MITLPIPSHFSFDECLWFLDRNFDDCAHTVENKMVRKVLKNENSIGLIEIGLVDNCLNIKLLTGNLDESFTVDFVQEWFDLSREISPFYELLNKDRDFAYMVQNFNGLRLLGIPDAFEALCWCIIGQQINLKFAYSLKRRVTEAYGTKVVYEDKNYWLFPEPEVLAKLRPDELRIFQFSQKKAEYIIEAANQFANGYISKEILSELSTAEAITKLTSVRGIGEWTANYLLMKSLRRMECITHGDVGLFNALALIKGYPKRPDKQQILALFANFKGWEAYLVFYLWRSLVVR